MFLQVIEQAARPDDFSGREQGEAGKDRHPTGAGRHKHDDAGKEQRESDHNLDEALGLLQGLEPHSSKRRGTANRHRSKRSDLRGMSAKPFYH